jgi:hypothetical protein
MRQACAYYHQTDSDVIIERLCEPDRLDVFVRVSASMLGPIRDFEARRRQSIRDGVAAQLERGSPRFNAGG